MAKLILSMDGLVLKEIPLTKERTTIGRKPHNDIQIDNLAVSGEHAVIVTILNDSFLEDLGSTNGTLVNGQPVKKHFLQNNDVIELGKYKLKYVTEATAAQAQSGRFREDHGAARAACVGASPSPSRKRARVRPRAPPACKSVRRHRGQPRDDANARAWIARSGAASRQRASSCAVGCRSVGCRRLPLHSPLRRPSRPPRRQDPCAAAARPRGAHRAGAARPACAHSVARHDPDPVRPQRRQGAAAVQAAHHARQARRAGRGHRQTSAGLFHHARRRRDLPRSQRQAARRAGARAQRSRCDRAGRRQDGVLPQDRRCSRNPG